MNRDRIEGRWMGLLGKIKEPWSKPTDDDLDVVAGRRDRFAGPLQECHGLAEEDAEAHPGARQHSAADYWLQRCGATP